MQPPFHLDTGLWLENSRTLLPWGATVEELTRLGAPEVYRHSTSTNICWNDEKVLGDLRVDVDMNGAAGPNAFYLRSQIEANSVQEEYEQLLFKLSDLLGVSHSTVVDDGYPWSRWQWGDVAVSLRIAERFVEYVVLMVSKGILRG